MSDSTLAERLHRIAMEVAIGRPRPEAIAELVADGGLTEVGADNMLTHALGETDEQLWPLSPEEIGIDDVALPERSTEHDFPEALRYFGAAAAARRAHLAQLRARFQPGADSNDGASMEDRA